MCAATWRRCSRRWRRATPESTSAWFLPSARTTTVIDALAAYSLAALAADADDTPAA